MSHVSYEKKIHIPLYIPDKSENDYVNVVKRQIRFKTLEYYSRINTYPNKHFIIKPVVFQSISNW